jgi:lipopolysaccharide export system permease protein
LFFFDDIAVIPTLMIKNDLSRTLLHQDRPEGRSDIVIRARYGRLIYAVDYFDFYQLTMYDIVIIEHDDNGRLGSLIRAPRAFWTGEHWELANPVIYEWVDGLLRIRNMESTNEYREDPDTFRRNMVNVEELNFRDVRGLVQDLQIAGLPYLNALADYYHRFSFATVPFVVIILSISMGGRFSKNILLMSLLSSLIAAVIFYVMEMISMMLARLGYVPPLAGAWFPVATFIIAGIILLRTAKT